MSIKPLQLGALVDDITVGWVGPMVDEYVETGVPFLRTLNVLPYVISMADIKHITPEFHEKISKSKLRPGDVVIARTGRPGIAAVMPNWLGEANCSDLVIVRTGAKVDARFLAYYLNSQVGKDLVHARNVGSVQKHFNIGAAKTLPFPSTSILEQRRIAAVLGALDDKIELNREMNRTLEALAQALFKSWFVDFDGCEDLVESEIGLVPRGWGVGTLGGIVQFQNGNAFKSKDWEDEGVPVVKIGSVRPMIVDLGNVSYVSEEIAISADRYRLNVGDILIGMTGYVGEVGRVPYVPVLPLLNQRVGRVLFSSDDDKHLFYGFVYCLMRTSFFKEYVEKMAHGSAQANVSGKSILRFELAYPPKENLESFNQLIVPVLERILVLDLESRTLAELRDVLLPKLISGELRVEEAEALVGELV